MLRNAYVFASCLMFCTFVGQARGGGDEVPGNTVLLNGAIDSLVSQLMVKADLGQGATAWLRARQEQPGDWFVGQRMSQCLSELGRVVHFGAGIPMNSTARPPYLSVDFIVTRLRITFTPKGRRGWLGPGMARRRAQVELIVTVTTGEDSKVVWSGNLSSSNTDLVRSSTISALNHDTPPFVERSELPRGRLGRFVEPTLALAATAATGYLLFSLRSR